MRCRGDVNAMSALLTVYGQIAC